ncbi:ArsR/SmtB family transcription factor [Methanobrevibacter sp. DSM 116169]|uniref:ArsR/SmtB family transcription factor n=1 Tax=Methanobrevibacter sp. DSM 116169 TaxID=3242727 RepID=UPI0038FC5E4F
MKNLFNSLFLSSRGGKTRIKIVEALFKKSYNTNQLAKTLGMQYRTINYHLEILLDKEIVEKEDKKYGASYFISNKLYKNKKYLEEIKKIIG